MNLFRLNNIHTMRIYCKILKTDSKLTVFYLADIVTVSHILIGIGISVTDCKMSKTQFFRLSLAQPSRTFQINSLNVPLGVDVDEFVKTKI